MFGSSLSGAKAHVVRTTAIRMLIGSMGVASVSSSNQSGTLTTPSTSRPPSRPRRALFAVADRRLLAAASLEGGEGEIRTIWDGRGRTTEPEQEHLSEIVDIVNERFGMHLGAPDQLLFDQFEEAWASDPDLAAQAQHNDLENFRLAFDRGFMHTVVIRMDDNEAIFKQILDDDEFRALLEAHYAEKVYDRLRTE